MVLAAATASASGPSFMSRFSSANIARQLGSIPRIGVPAAAIGASFRTFDSARPRANGSSPFENAGRPQHVKPARSTRNPAASRTRTAAIPTRGSL